MTVARNLLGANVLCLEPQTPIGLAVNIMQRRGETSVAVLDANESIVGILAESDIMKMFVNPDSDDGIEGDIVGDFMTKG